MFNHVELPPERDNRQPRITSSAALFAPTAVLFPARANNENRDWRSTLPPSLDS